MNSRTKIFLLCASVPSLFPLKTGKCTQQSEIGNKFKAKDSEQDPKGKERAVGSFVLHKLLAIIKMKYVQNFVHQQTGDVKCTAQLL